MGQLFTLRNIFGLSQSRRDSSTRSHRFRPRLELLEDRTVPAVINEFLVPTPGAYPLGITAGPDGNLWFAEDLGNKIGRITPSGVITEFTVPTASAQPNQICLGPDGNLWFTEIGPAAHAIGRLTPAGVFSEFPTLTPNSYPEGITAGPDGNIWFTTYYGGGRVGYITPTGVVTEFGPFGDGISEIVAGPDGNLWFTESPGGSGGFSGNNAIGRITTSGVVTHFTIPTPNSRPTGICVGPDGNLWFAEQIGNIGRITTAGVITEFAVPTANCGPYMICAGPDGNLWFTELNVNANQIGSITPAGVITEYAVPASSDPFGPAIVAGPDGNIWFTHSGENKIFQFVLQQPVTQVAIDIKPGGGDNSINIANNGVIPVALFGSASFNVTQVDIGSVVFAGAHVAHYAFQDVNGDGYQDLMLHFRTQETNLRAIYEALLAAADTNTNGMLDPGVSTRQTTTISLTGRTTLGQQFEASDMVTLFLSGRELRDFLVLLASRGEI